MVRRATNNVIECGGSTPAIAASASLALALRLAALYRHTCAGGPLVIPFSETRVLRSSPALLMTTTLNALTLLAAARR